MWAARRLEGAAETIALGRELALFARPGLLLLLEGELGAGKSTLARALIRSLAADGNLDVPSPTFTLIQTYDALRVPVAHADLFRLRDAAEADELGLDELLRSSCVIVEWPERLGDLPGIDWLRVGLDGSGDARLARFGAGGAGRLVLERMAATEAFLRQSGWGDAERRYLQGDASYRRYERLTRPDGRTAILCDMPPRPPEPVLRDGKTYSEIVHRAEGIRSVVDISRELRGRGFSAPASLSDALDAGLALVEDLGDNVFVRSFTEGADMTVPMETATAVLAALADQDWPASLPPYDHQALAIEVETLPDWFWPLVKGESISADARNDFIAIWSGLLPLADYGRPYWVLRDYHSPNLLWLPGRQGLQRVGIIDTQDTVLGHPAYDLAAFLQDARTTIPEPLAERLFERYCSLRKAVFDRPSFATAYTLLGAQRATKILGIFARLAVRDGKRHYLEHVARVSRYLEKDLQHPELAPLKVWFDRHLPHELRLQPA